jgi:hypothetical protein
VVWTFKLFALSANNVGGFELSRIPVAPMESALVSISRSSDPTHVLHASVVEVPANQPIADALMAHPGFRDLEAEAHAQGLLAMQRSFDQLLNEQSCPRCKAIGKLELSQIQYLGQHVRY